MVKGVERIRIIWAKRNSDEGLKMTDAEAKKARVGLYETYNPIAPSLQTTAPHKFFSKYVSYRPKFSYQYQKLNNTYF